MSERPSIRRRPDLVIRRSADHTEDRWLVIEVKGGERKVEQSARAAAFDLLAYRTAFETALSGVEGPFALGIAWGSGLEPAADEPIMLCTPDTIPDALKLLFS
jgi:hypothetical protein